MTIDDFNAELRRLKSALQAGEQEKDGLAFKFRETLFPFVAHLGPEEWSGAITELIRRSQKSARELVVSDFLHAVRDVQGRGEATRTWASKNVPYHKPHWDLIAENVLKDGLANDLSKRIAQEIKQSRQKLKTGDERARD